MSHNTYTRGGGDWTDGTDTITAADLESFEQKMYKAVNGDDGGTWNPSAAIVVGGSGANINPLVQGATNMSSGTMYVANIAALKALTGMTDGRAVFVKRYGWYFYEDPNATAETSPWLIAPTSGTGRWFHEHQAGQYTAGANFATANGLAPLDASAKVPNAYVHGNEASGIATLDASTRLVQAAQKIYTVADTAAMVALTSPADGLVVLAGSSGLFQFVLSSSMSVNHPFVWADTGATGKWIAVGGSNIINHTSGLPQLDSSGHLAATFGGAANTICPLDGSSEVAYAYLPGRVLVAENRNLTPGSLVAITTSYAACLTYSLTGIAGDRYALTIDYELSLIAAGEDVWVKIDDGSSDISAVKHYYAPTDALYVADSITVYGEIDSASVRLMVKCNLGSTTSHIKGTGAQFLCFRGANP